MSKQGRMGKMLLPIELFIDKQNKWVLPSLSLATIPRQLALLKSKCKESNGTNASNVCEASYQKPLTFVIDSDSIIFGIGF